MQKQEFFNLYNHGFIRVAVCIPQIRVANPIYNAKKTLDLCYLSSQNNVILAIFPELGISAYSNEDLFHQDALLKEVLESIQLILNRTKKIETIFIIGAPLKINSCLFNCALTLYKGKILGISVKSYLPNYREYSEVRHFKPSFKIFLKKINLCNQNKIPFGANLLFDIENIPNFCFYTEICEDLWVPIPPSSYAAMAGATVITNLSASNFTIEKSEYRHHLISSQSFRCIAAYLYAASGPGESTTDLGWDGNSMIYENGLLLSETKKFTSPQIIYAEIDLDKLSQERMKKNTFADNALSVKQKILSFQKIKFKITINKQKKLLLLQNINRYPYIPRNFAKKKHYCYEIYSIQVQGLAKRIKSSGVDCLIIGVSGGLDSTNALIVAAKTMDILGKPRSNIKAYTMPGFATSLRTYNNAMKLMSALKVEVNEIDIKSSCLNLLKNIKHPFAYGHKIYDTTFENVQAGERTSYLFRIANYRNGLVVGTGNMSELALGWCTFGVGDQMSHYNVNVSLSKTLIQYLISCIIESNLFNLNISDILLDIINTNISPELVPIKQNDNNKIHNTESIIGPYELQDFNIFYIVRYGFLPTKIAFMSYSAWHNKYKGNWPNIYFNKRNQYDIKTIKNWLIIFITRFFKYSQFKRSTMPNGPKIDSGASLSPRGDYRAPSDSEVETWLRNIEKIPDAIIIHSD